MKSQPPGPRSFGVRERWGPCRSSLRGSLFPGRREGVHTSLVVYRLCSCSASVLFTGGLSDACSALLICCRSKEKCMGMRSESLATAHTLVIIIIVSAGAGAPSLRSVSSRELGPANPDCMVTCQALCQALHWALVGSLPSGTLDGRSQRMGVSESHSEPGDWEFIHSAPGGISFSSCLGSCFCLLSPPATPRPREVITVCPHLSKTVPASTCPFSRVSRFAW